VTWLWQAKRPSGGGGGGGGDSRLVTLSIKESDIIKALSHKPVYVRPLSLLRVHEIAYPREYVCRSLNLRVCAMAGGCGQGRILNAMPPPRTGPSASGLG
jgi:hypothetical protein